MFGDDGIVLSRAEYAKKEHHIATGRIEFFADRLSVCGYDFPFTEITTAIQGVRKMTIYHRDAVYAVVCPYRVNIIKYMMCAYRLRHVALGIEEDYYGY